MISSSSLPKSVAQQGSVRERLQKSINFMLRQDSDIWNKETLEPLLAQLNLAVNDEQAIEIFYRFYLDAYATDYRSPSESLLKSLSKFRLSKIEIPGKVDCLAELIRNYSTINVNGKSVINSSEFWDSKKKYKKDSHNILAQVEKHGILGDQLTRYALAKAIEILLSHSSYSRSLANCFAYYIRSIAKMGKIAQGCLLIDDVQTELQQVHYTKIPILVKISTQEADALYTKTLDRIYTIVDISQSPLITPSFVKFYDEKLKPLLPLRDEVEEKIADFTENNNASSSSSHGEPSSDGTSQEGNPNISAFNPESPPPVNPLYRTLNQPGEDTCQEGIPFTPSSSKQIYKTLSPPGGMSLRNNDEKERGNELNRSVAHANSGNVNNVYPHIDKTPDISFFQSGLKIDNAYPNINKTPVNLELSANCKRA